MAANVKHLEMMVLFVQCGVSPHALQPKSYAPEEPMTMVVKKPMSALIDQLETITHFAQDIAQLSVTQ